MRINENGQNYLNRIGKVSYLRNFVILEQNNGTDYYVYCINLFILIRNFYKLSKVKRCNNIIFKILLYKNYIIFYFFYVRPIR